VEGLNWLLAAWHGRRNVILADEMGLGKTAQTVALFEHLHRSEGTKGPFLVIAPLSTIAHWRREIEAWTELSACVYHGSGGLGKTGQEVRALIREWEWYYPGYARDPAALRFDVLVTTYEIAIQDVEFLAEIPWVVMIVDEGHRLRGAGSKLKEVLQGHLYNDRGDIAEKGIEADFRVLLTGTPLQNSMAELWSLLNFLEPDEFDDLESFNEEFGDLRTQTQVEKLQQMLAPHLLRRVKEDVEKSIPRKEETIIEVELTLVQKQYYRAIFERNRLFLYRGCDKSNLPGLSNIEMQLRKCCNHPYLINGVEDKDVEDFESQLK